MKVITIGRSSANDIVINDEKVSRHHLQIIQDDLGNFHLTDLGSLNGTYVNGNRIFGEVLLTSYDVIKVGNTVLPWRTYFEDHSTQTVPPSCWGTETETWPNYFVADPPVDYIPLRERHGFITFFFILGLVGFVLIPIIGILSFVGFSSMTTGVYDNSMVVELGTLFMINMIFSVFCGIFGIICIVLLFNWKRIGFYGLILNNVLYSAFNIFLSYKVAGITGENFSSLVSLLYVMGLALGCFIFYLVLQIKKHGIKFWDNLE